MPNIFEVESLSERYKVLYRAILEAFGLGSKDLAQEPSAESYEENLPWRFGAKERPFSFTFQRNIKFDSTRLVTENPEELGVPAAVRQRLDAGQFRLGIIGLNDDTMDDLVPGGSVVVDRQEPYIRRDEGMEKYPGAPDLLCLARERL